MPLTPQKASFPGDNAISFQFSSRLARLRESIGRKKIHGFLVTDIVNVRYLSGFLGSSGFVFVTAEKSIFVTDFRYREQAERELSGGVDSGWEIVIEKGDRIKVIRALIRRLGVRVLGFESTLSYETYEGLSKCCVRLKPLRGVPEKLRAVKDGEEIRLIRAAVKRAEDAFLDIKPYIRQGRREKGIALMLEESLKKKGCNRLPFDIIVASGVNSAMPHARPTDKKLSPGDFVVIDWGGEAEGYCSDMTRTLLVGGGDLLKKKHIYNAVLEANRAAVSSIVPGAVSRSIDAEARNSIKNAGYGEFFGHGTGHGVGLEVHEMPRITWTRSDAVEENMVFTIEPGIYIEDIGGVRIEDMILVKADGAELLTKLPRRLEII